MNGVPHITAQGFVDVDNPLKPGSYRFRLTVVDSADLESEPTELTVTVAEPVVEQPTGPGRVDPGRIDPGRIDLGGIDPGIFGPRGNDPRPIDPRGPGRVIDVGSVVVEPGRGAGGLGNIGNLGNLGNLGIGRGGRNRPGG
jgi:hypothetical protein